ncbi:hypothetical protein QJQ45_011715 [Haematococcus lacustris]|nr:hypothetical protein QJQ45_011715 [Haematococcus lacustris]
MQQGASWACPSECQTADNLCQSSNPAQHQGSLNLVESYEAQCSSSSSSSSKRSRGREALHGAAVEVRLEAVRCGAVLCCAVLCCAVLCGAVLCCAVLCCAVLCGAVRCAWSQERGQPVRGLMWCPVVAPRKPPQSPRSSQAATQPAASEPGPSTPPPAKRSKPAAEPTKGKGKGKAAKAKPAPQPGRWLDRDCNAALNMQRIGESRWRPLELCYWPDQGALPAKGKEYPGLGYKRVRDKPPKAQEQQQQPAEAQLARQTAAAALSGWEELMPTLLPALIPAIACWRDAGSTLSRGHATSAHAQAVQEKMAILSSIPAAPVKRKPRMIQRSSGNASPPPRRFLSEQMDRVKSGYYSMLLSQGPDATQQQLAAVDGLVLVLQQGLEQAGSANPGASGSTTAQAPRSPAMPTVMLPETYQPDMEMCTDAFRILASAYALAGRAAALEAHFQSLASGALGPARPDRTSCSLLFSAHQEAGDVAGMWRSLQVTASQATAQRVIPAWLPTLSYQLTATARAAVASRSWATLTALRPFAASLAAQAQEQAALAPLTGALALAGQQLQQQQQQQGRLGLASGEGPGSQRPGRPGSMELRIPARIERDCMVAAAEAGRLVEAHAALQALAAATRTALPQANVPELLVLLLLLLLVLLLFPRLLLLPPLPPPLLLLLLPLLQPGSGAELPLRQPFRVEERALVPVLKAAARAEDPLLGKAVAQQAWAMLLDSLAASSSSSSSQALQPTATPEQDNSSADRAAGTAEVEGTGEGVLADAAGQDSEASSTHSRPHPSPACFHAYIQTLCRAGDWGTAFDVVGQLEAAHAARRPTTVSVHQGLAYFPQLLAATPRACATAYQTLARRQVSGQDVSVVMMNCVLRGLALAGAMEQCGRLFEEYEVMRLPQDLAAYNTVVESCCVAKKPLAANGVLEYMTSQGVAPSTDTFDLLLKGFIHVGDAEGALLTLQRLRDTGTRARLATLKAALQLAKQQSHQAAVWVPYPIIARRLPPSACLPSLPTSFLLAARWQEEFEVEMERVLGKGEQPQEEEHEQYDTEYHTDEDMELGGGRGG